MQGRVDLEAGVGARLLTRYTMLGGAVSVEPVRLELSGPYQGRSLVRATPRTAAPEATWSACTRNFNLNVSTSVTVQSVEPLRKERVKLDNILGELAWRPCGANAADAGWGALTDPEKTIVVRNHPDSDEPEPAEPDTVGAETTSAGG